MEEIIESSKSNVMAAKGRLLNSFSFVPEEKQEWSPSPTAKSAWRIVAHCVVANQVFAATLRGEPVPGAAFAELIARGEEQEKKLATKAAAVAALEESTCWGDLDPHV